MKALAQQVFLYSLCGDGNFIFHTEDVPEAYKSSRHSQRPLVCLDEKPLQVLEDIIPALPVKPGREKIFDSRALKELSIFSRLWRRMKGTTMRM